jgi:sRNA-binding carbon storage regulator CsrA
MALFLNRKRGESVFLRDEIRGEIICVVSVSELLPNGVVRLSFDADRAISISRDNMIKGKGERNGDDQSETTNGDSKRKNLGEVDGNR